MIRVSKSFLSKEPLAEGGEAKIYDANEYVLKIFKPNTNLNEKEKNIRNLINADLPKNVIGPLDIVCDERDRFIGYSMKKIEGEEFRKLCSKKFLKLNNISINDISKMLFQIHKTLNVIHSKKIYIGDLNDCNILFDNKFNVYLIDVDSWSIGNHKCQVCMESFKDPKMKGDNFDEKTDWYAFAIIVFKALTMLHPFGGRTDPDMDILTRMQLGLSVIDNDKITVPKRLCKNWKFMSPQLLKDLKSIFNEGKRFNFEESFIDFVKNLTKCSKHGDYYYSNYSKCPICNLDATLIEKPEKPIKTLSNKGIPFKEIFTNDNIKIMLDENTYVDDKNVIHFKGSRKIYDYDSSNRYYKLGKATIVSYNDYFEIILKGEKFNFKKQKNSRIIVKNDLIYFINQSHKLVQLKFDEKGNSIIPITDISFNSCYEAFNDEHYIVCNIYNDIKILCIDGFNFELKNKHKIINYGMHFDPITKYWLLVLEYSNGKFHIMIFNKNKLIYDNDSFKFTNDLGYICFYNNTIYTPKDGAIRGFNYTKNAVKDFECEIVTLDSILRRTGPKFNLINDNGVYEIG